MTTPAFLRTIFLCTAAAALLLPAAPHAAASPVTKKKAQQTGKKQEKPQTNRSRRKTTRLKKARMFTWGTREIQNPPNTSRDPVLGTVEGAQAGMTLRYSVQGESKKAEAVKSRDESRTNFAAAENWNVAIVDDVVVHDKATDPRITEVRPTVVEVGAPFRVSGERQIRKRTGGRVSKHRTNTATGHTEGLPQNQGPRAPGPAPYENIHLTQGAQVRDGNTRLQLDSGLAGDFKPFVVRQNIGISPPRNPDGNGVGDVSILNYAALPRGAKVVVTNLHDRTQSTSFVAGERKGNNTNRGVLKAKDGTPLRMHVTMPNGQAETVYMTLSLNGKGSSGKAQEAQEAPQVLIAARGRRANRTGRNRRTQAYYRAQTVEPRPLRISPAIRSAAADNAFVAAVRIPDALQTGNVTVKNLTTDQTVTIDASKAGELRIPAQLNDRLQISYPGHSVTVFVPAHNDGKLLERSETSRRPFYEPKVSTTNR